jgi:hypothetical protein
MTYLLYIGLEAFLVGLFCVVLYLGLSWIKPFLLLLFVLGVFKHSLGYISGIESLYCTYGQACRQACEKQACEPAWRKAHTHQLLLESILEGLAFLVIGLIFYKTTTPIRMVFLTGVLLHLIAEFSGLHARFCQKNCILSV